MTTITPIMTMPVTNVTADETSDPVIRDTSNPDVATSPNFVPYESSPEFLQ